MLVLVCLIAPFFTLPLPRSSCHPLNDLACDSAASNFLGYQSSTRCLVTLVLPPMSYLESHQFYRLRLIHKNDVRADALHGEMLFDLLALFLPFHSYQTSPMAVQACPIRCLTTKYYHHHVHLP